MSSIDTCTTCTHTKAEHSDVAGCYADTGRDFCDCKTFVSSARARNETLEQGRTLRDEGMAKAGTGVPGPSATEWRLNALEAIGHLVALGEEFSADDVVARAGEPPHPNMLGPLFANAARADVISAVGFRQATRPSAHARIQRTWKGKG